MDDKLIIVYSTLKCGFYTHTLMLDLISRNDAVFLGTHLTVLPYPLVCVPREIPYLIDLPGKAHRIRGELHSVTGRDLGPLDDLEGVDVGHYQRLPIRVVREREGVVLDAEAHFAHRSFRVGLWERNDRKG